MGLRYKLLEDLLRELWFYIKDLLYSSDVENILITGPKIWGTIQLVGEPHTTTLMA